MDSRLLRPVAATLRRTDGFRALIDAGERWALAHVYGASRCTGAVDSSAAPGDAWRSLGVTPLPKAAAVWAARATHDVPVPDAVLQAAVRAETATRTSRGNPALLLRQQTWPRHYVEQMHRRLPLVEAHWQQLRSDMERRNDHLAAPGTPSGSGRAPLPSAALSRSADVVSLAAVPGSSPVRNIVVQNLVHTTYWSTALPSFAGAAFATESARRRGRDALSSSAYSSDAETTRDSDAEDADDETSEAHEDDAYDEAALSLVGSVVDVPAELRWMRLPLSSRQASVRTRDEALAAVLAAVDRKCAQLLDLRLLAQRAGHLWPQLGTVQLNKTIVRYVHKWAATHVFFDKARIYETGGCEHARSECIVRHTLAHVSSAIGVRLHFVRRVCQNTVATLHLDYPLLLPLLRQRHRTFVKYKPERFTGAIVNLPEDAADLLQQQRRQRQLQKQSGRRKRPRNKRGIKALAFRSGQIVFIGARKLDRIADAARRMLVYFRESRDTPENNALLKTLQDKHQKRATALVQAADTAAAAASTGPLPRAPYRPPRCLPVFRPPAPLSSSPMAVARRLVAVPAPPPPLPPSISDVVAALAVEQSAPAAAADDDANPRRQSLKRSAGQEMLWRAAKRHRTLSSSGGPSPSATSGRKGTRLID